MRFILSIVALSAVAAIFIGGAGSRLGNVWAAPVTFELQASGAEEVPPCNTAGSAFGRFTFDDVTRELTFAITISGISSNQVIGSHFHRGVRGTNGPIIYRFADAAFGQVAGRLTIAAEDVEQLKTGGFYWNNHSLECPGGFARAQVFIPAAAAPAPAATAAPAAIAPPSTGDGGMADDGGSMPLTVLLAALVLTGFGALGLAYKAR